VVAIQQNYWPKEWIYLIRIEEKGQLPKIRYAILDRNGLKSEDNLYHIRPTALLPADGDEALFFNKFEQQTKVTVIQQSSPGCYETICLVQPLLAQLSPRAIIQYIAGHRLFKLNESPSIGRHSDQTRDGSTERPDSTLKPEITRDLTPVEAGPRAVSTGTITNQNSQTLSPPPNLTLLLGLNPSEVPNSKRGRLTLEAERNLLHEHDGVVVIPKTIRLSHRSAKIPLPKQHSLLPTICRLHYIYT